MRQWTLVIALAVLCGLGAVTVWSAGDEPGYDPMPPITMDDPLPDGSVVVEVAATMDTSPVEPGAVIEATYIGRAAEGHAPCATLQRRRAGVWVATHTLGAAGTLDAGTSDVPVEQDDDGRIWADNDGDRFVVVCPAMNMTGAGPERFRLPIDLEPGPARLCPEIGWDICIPLQIR